MSELHVFSDDVEWYIAASAVDAMAAQRELTGMRESNQDPETWEQVPDERSLAIHMDDHGNAAEADAPVVTKTCAEWIAEQGRGFLCSTEY